MAHELLHPIACPCSSCRHPAEHRAHPDQLAAISGLLAGVGFGALLGGFHLVALVAEWLAQ